MNTEEKAHAYDEVMDKIKPLYEQAKRDGNPIWSTYEYLIPELADSEDEKVRKWIASYIHRGVFNEEEHPMALKAIEYLEKQKEQPISITEVLARAGLKPYKDGNKWCILAGDNIQEGICGFGDTIDEALYQFLLEVLEKQKAMDAIPDELVKSYKFFIENGRREIEEVVNAINNLNEQKKHQNKSDAPKEKKLGSNFYPSDKDKNAVKNPKREIPEWSEEDEKHLNSILDAIDYWETTSGQGILLDTDINWLKFLRWKKH